MKKAIFYTVPTEEQMAMIREYPEQAAAEYQRQQDIQQYHLDERLRKEVEQLEQQQAQVSD